MKKTVFVVGIAVMTLPFAACSTPEEKVEKAAEKVVDATADVCDEMDALGVALAQYGEVNAETPVGDVRSASAEVNRAWSKLETKLGKLDRAEARAMNATYEQYRRVVESIPDSATLGEASEQVSAALADMIAKQEALKSVACVD